MENWMQATVETMVVAADKKISSLRIESYEYSMTTTLYIQEALA